MATTSSKPSPSASSSSSSFNEENFMRKLDSVTPTQDSIQTLALWIIHHKSNHDVICRLWLKKLKEQSSHVKHRLALFYLANDVIQNCKRKNAKIYQDTFRKYLADAINIVKHDSINKNIERVLDVWAERNVYDREFTEILRKILKSESKLSPKEPAPVKQVAETPAPAKAVQEEPSIDVSLEQLIANFQPKSLCESISGFNSIISDLNLAKVGVEATRILDVNIDTIRQYRDRQQCSKFKSDFENSIVKLEEYIKKLTHQANQRKKLVELMEQGEIFYDAQFNDASRVFNAYRVYGHKVHTVKNKLDEIVQEKYSNDTKFDCVDMEMSDEDANNEKENSKYNNSGYRGSLSFSRTNSSGSMGGGSGSVRTNLDPRQNRTPSKKSSHYYNADSGHESHANSAGSSGGGGSSKRKHSYQDFDSSHSHKSKERDRSGTPVRDEIAAPPSNGSAQSSAPLDFLTKFINKSSNGASTSASNESGTSSSNSTSKNLSFIFNQLQKIVNNPAPSSSLMTMSGSESAMDAVHYQPHGSFPSNMPYYDPSAMPYVPTGPPFMINQQQTQQPPRSGTPTKDELYTATPIPQLQYSQVPAPSMLPSPNTPGAYNPMMAPPIGSMPPSPYIPMYQPQLMPPNMGIPPPQLMIDPNSSAAGANFHQNYMFNQPPPQVSPHGYYPSQPNQQGKVLVSPSAAAAGVSHFWNHQTASQQQQHQTESKDVGNVLNDAMVNKFNSSEKMDGSSSANTSNRKNSSGGGADMNESYSPDHRHNMSRHSSHSLSPNDSNKPRYSGSKNKYASGSSSSSSYKRKYSNDDYDNEEASYGARGGGGGGGGSRDNTSSRHYGNGQSHRHY